MRQITVDGIPNGLERAVDKNTATDKAEQIEQSVWILGRQIDTCQEDDDPTTLKEHLRLTSLAVMALADRMMNILFPSRESS